MAYDELFLDIRTALTLAQKERKMQDDLYIHDFSKAWGATSTERGGLMRDDYIPESYAQECIQAMQGKRKHPVTGRWVKDINFVQVEGTNVEIGKDSDSCGVTIRGTSGTIQFTTPEQWTAFLRVAMSLQAGTDTNTTAGFGGTSSNDLLPEQKRIRERNEEVMRKWSIASSKSYPKSR